MLEYFGCDLQNLKNTYVHGTFQNSYGKFGFQKLERHPVRVLTDLHGWKHYHRHYSRVKIGLKSNWKFAVPNKEISEGAVDDPFDLMSAPEIPQNNKSNEINVAKKPNILPPCLNIIESFCVMSMFLIMNLW